MGLHCRPVSTVEFVAGNHGPAAGGADVAGIRGLHTRHSRGRAAPEGVAAAVAADTTRAVRHSRVCSKRLSHCALVMPPQAWAIRQNK